MFRETKWKKGRKEKKNNNDEYAEDELVCLTFMELFIPSEGLMRIHSSTHVINGHVESVFRKQQILRCFPKMYI